MKVIGYDPTIHQCPDCRHIKNFGKRDLPNPATQIRRIVKATENQNNDPADYELILMVVGNIGQARKERHNIEGCNIGENVHSPLVFRVQIAVYKGEENQNQQRRPNLV